MRRAVSLPLILALVLFATGFTVLNSGFVPLNLYFYELKVPTSVLVFVCVALGAVLGMIASSGALMRRQAEARRLKKTISRLESEIESLHRAPQESAAGESSSLPKAG